MVTYVYKLIIRPKAELTFGQYIQIAQVSGQI